MCAGGLLKRFVLDRTTFVALKVDIADFASWGVIKDVTNLGLRCLTCSDWNTKHCRHINSMRLQDHNNGDQAVSPTQLHPAEAEKKMESFMDYEQGCRMLTCVSRNTIPEVPEDLGSALYQYVEEGGCIYPDPSHRSRTCSCCKSAQPNWSIDAVVPAETCVVFYLNHARYCKFAYYQCEHVHSNGTQCSGRLEVDGSEVCVLRKTSKTAFSYELLYSWSNHCGVSAVSWWGFWRDTLMKYAKHSLQEKKAWFTRLRRSFVLATLDFIQLQCIDYRSSFSCHHGHSTIICDGITLGFHKDKCYLYHPWQAHNVQMADRASGAEPVVTAGALEPGAGAVVQSILVPGSSFGDRVFVRDEATRALLVEFTNIKKPSTAGLDIGKLEQLRSKLSSCGPRGASLLPFTESESPWVESYMASSISITRPNDTIRGLLFSLGTSAPASQIIKPQLHAAMATMCTASITMQHLELCKTYNPTLFRLLKSYVGTTMPPALKQLLLLVLEVAKSCSKPSPALDQRNPRIVKPSRRAFVFSGSTARHASIWSSEEAYFRTGAWTGMPSAEEWQPSWLGGSDVRRPLRLYHADRYRCGTKQACTKHKNSTAKLIPGCEFLWCSRCGICVMYCVMDKAESPQTVFEMMYTRMQQAPKRLVYDNGCNTHQYCFNREPEYFRETEFFVDEHHYAGHVACPADYNTKDYAGITNASMAEQRNALLRRLESSCAYMNQTTFLVYIRYFVHKMNKLQRDKKVGRCFWA